MSPVPDDTVSRETSRVETAATDVSRETADTPIAREAAQAVRLQPGFTERWANPPTTRVISVANQKGGVGKTTSVVNVAAALALHGARVLLIDLDPQGNASTALGAEHGVGVPSTYDVLLDHARLVTVLQSVELIPGLVCVPATLDLAGAEIELVGEPEREFRLRRAIDDYVATNEVDYIFVDCPPSLGLLTINALAATSELFIPIQCEYYALEGLAQLLNTVDLVRDRLNPELAVSTVLLTMYDSRTRLADQVAAEVRTHFGEIVLTPMIPRNVRVSEAPGFGQTVLTYDPGSRGAASYVEASREFAKHVERAQRHAPAAEQVQTTGVDRGTTR